MSAHSVDTDITYPWDQGSKALNADELKRRDTWQSRFMPSGAMVAGRVDTLHWLTFGTPEILPLLYSEQPALMVNGRQQAVVRVGVLKPNKDAEKRARNQLVHDPSRARSERSNEWTIVARSGVAYRELGLCYA